jgi:hypothetical protein
VSPQQVAGILRQLHSAYQTEVTREMGELWSNTFAGDDDEMVRDAVHEWIRERTYFPSPADLRQVMRGIMRRTEPERALTTVSATPITGLEGGWKIAYDAYCQTVRRDGREPKPFEIFRNGLPKDDRGRPW